MDQSSIALPELDVAGSIDAAAELPNASSQFKAHGAIIKAKR